MRNKSFGEFVDKKKRESVKQLMLIKQLLENQGMKVENFLTTSEDDPYIFCFCPTRNGSFDGIRVYKIGSELAFRIQKENETHPYGAAYPLPVEEMFHDLLGDEDDSDQMKAGKKVIEAINKEVRSFFDKSIDAERDERERNIDMEKDTEGNVLVRTTGTDYSSLVYNKT